MSAPQKNHHEEEDLDDLDDVLDQFSSKPSASTQQAAKGAQGAAKPSGSQTQGVASSDPTSQSKKIGTDEAEDDDGLPSGFDDALSKQFAAELAKGMEDMFGNAAAAGPSTRKEAAGSERSTKDTGVSGEPEMSEEEMMKQFEKIMAEMGMGEGGPSADTRGSASASASGPQPPQQAADFQDAIKSTMSRLKQSSAQGGGAGGANPFGDFSEDDMAKLLSSLGGGEGGEMPEGEEGMAKMLEKMMGELMSKEVLYEPLKELRDKYPSYLAAPPADVKPEDLARYRDQHRIVSQVIETFDDVKFDNGSESEKKALKERVSSLMNEMQEGGAPPPEVAGEMPEGLDGIPGLGGNGGPGNEEDCVVM